MAVGEPLQRQFPALRVQEAERRCTGNNATNCGDGNVGGPRGLRKYIDAVARDRAENFVVVAPGDESLDADHLSRQQRARR